ncbi:helix-turn-helix domain-containing protein [Streptomyces zagrosensis]|uniref:Transcriptional regulator with XRE-family HTH domain n=1 Tax=Streptomyces zagrosensis TaxID=1042984 RepID=A0A7W9Q649_9ACTN|nr:helix-turn-helix transcriptional regulator [Streptomyces zagrosensis]MBB5934206.1 transcriptional regulator with XRE-family HTH domain [Streptomyces zagrosensis]
MSDRASSPQMKMFGAVVRALREEKNVSREDLAVHVGYSQSMVCAVEYGERLASEAFVTKAGQLLKATKTLEAAVPFLSWDKHPWWFGEYVDREKEAVCLYCYDSHVIKGLLQTEAYMRAIFNSHCPALDDEGVESLVQARLERQVLLTRAPAADLALVIEESALRRPIGGRAVHKEQLGRILDLTSQRNISLQVMPTSYEGHSGLDGSMTLLQSPNQRWLVYLEVQAKSMVIDDPREVAEFQSRYGMIRTQALPPGESVKLIEQMAGEL